MAEKSVRWAQDEIDKFNEAIKKYSDLESITEYIGSRTYSSVRSRLICYRQKLRLDPKHPDAELLSYMRRIKVTQMVPTTDNKDHVTWSLEEQDKYQEAVEKYGDDAEKIAEHIGTKNAYHVKSKI